MVVAAGRGTAASLVWLTTCVTALMVVAARGSLAWSSTICDLKACSCQAGGPGRLACDCRSTGLQELVLQSEGVEYIPHMISSITIENCETVRITKDAFNPLVGLQSVNLLNINNLDLDEHAFYWNNVGDESRLHPGIKISIMHTSIEELPSYAFRGMIHTILLNNCTIDDIQVFSFASLINTERIDIIDSKIDNIQSQAFKKFSLNSLTIYNTILPILPSRTMIDLEIISELRFERVDFDVIRSSSIIAHGMQIVRLLNNRINRLEKESIVLRTKGSVIFQDNVINDVMADSISAIKVDERFLKEEGRQDFTFMNTTVVSFENNPFTFNTSNFVPRIESFNIWKQCSCEDVKTWLTKTPIITLVNNFNKDNNKSNIKNDKQPWVPDMSSLISCKLGHNRNYNNDLITFKLYDKKNCIETSYKKYLVVSVTVTAITSVIVGIIYLLLRNRMKRYINVPTSNGGDKMSYKNTRNPIMVVPEGKTYRETELHVIEEQVEPIVECSQVRKYEN